MFSTQWLPILLGVGLLASAGQIPVVNNVHGGVSGSTASTGSPKVVKPSKLLGPINPGKLRYVQNSGVCETTPGVFTASGYADLTSSQSMWFWFFEARNNPDTAPVSIWLNGGPGSSSMLGLFQENGPCRINSEGTATTLNPYSWNTNANMIFIDQPIGVGFSYGDQEVGTSQEAAQAVWQMLQIFFADPSFSKYAGNDFALWTESYGGHYGPTMAAFFLQQNAAIQSGSLSGTVINLKTLGIGNGLTDPLSQYLGYIQYAQSNPYQSDFTPSSREISSANSSFFRSGGCQSQIQSCYNGGSASVCSRAQSFCNNDILEALIGDTNVYDVRPDSSDYPPDISDLMTQSSFVQKIGAEVTNWQETDDTVYENFAETGDWMHNSAPDLETVINAGVRTVVYDGDADFICNFRGVEDMVNNLKTDFSTQFAQLAFTNWTVAGTAAGLVKNAGTFSYVRIFGAGHQVPAYGYENLADGQAALQMFDQAMTGKALTNT